MNENVTIDRCINIKCIDHRSEESNGCRRSVAVKSKCRLHMSSTDTYSLKEFRCINCHAKIKTLIIAKGTTLSDFDKDFECPSCGCKRILQKYYIDEHGEGYYQTV